MAAADADTEVQIEFFPVIRQYKSGRVERFMKLNPLPAGVDPATGVTSKDVAVDPGTGTWARLFLPPGSDGKKFPVFVYYHGGAFVTGSVADPFTHRYLVALAAEAGVLAVALEYRLAPENPLPAAHEDSWEGLRWVASHAAGGDGGGEGSEPWLAEHGDFTRVFLAGASAGGSIVHHIAVRAGEHGGLGIRIRGLLVVHPCFNGAADIGSEATPAGKAAKEKADAFWRFLCPGTTGLDDPLCNPFSEAACGSAARVAAERVLVCVAENDDFRDRGVWYYESLTASGYRGEVELLESAGEGHIFHCIEPRCDRAREMQDRVLGFLRK